MIEWEAQPLLYQIHQIKRAEESLRTALAGTSTSATQVSSAVDLWARGDALAGSSASATQVSSAVDLWARGDALAGSSASATQVSSAMDLWARGDALAGSSASATQVSSAMDLWAWGDALAGSSASVAQAAEALVKFRNDLAHNVHWGALENPDEVIRQFAYMKDSSGLQETSIPQNHDSADLPSGSTKIAKGEAESSSGGAIPVAFEGDERLRPPLTGEKFMYLFLPKKDREALLGDLEEEYRSIILPKFGPRFARIWYWKQVLTSILPIVRCRIVALLKLLSLAKVLEWVSRMGR
jgi:hypothetical protein